MSAASAPILDIDAEFSLEGPTPDPHSSFTLQSTTPIHSLQTRVEAYRHLATGAMHYHLHANKAENVFLVALRTVPQDSTGVAHILEHTALCGSKKYPVRDPFFMMIRRSLNTFMNAFTSSDWTAYPFASQNRKDFSNLLDVYLDAVFFARLHELDFAQEGHRIEFKEPTDPKTPLQYKGVVFNEMKGAMSSPGSMLWDAMTRYLFPTSTYHHNSGGDPETIPNLSHEELKAFYKSHYHPSNAIFMTFGDIPAAQHQAVFEDRALRHFERSDVRIAVREEKRYHAPICVEEAYACDDANVEEKSHIVLGWLLGKSTDLKGLLKAKLLSLLLLDNSASPLLQALETTDLATTPSPLCGIEDSNHEMCFLSGVEGSNKDNAQAIEKLILDTLQTVAENGLPQEDVEAALHQLELSQREISGDSSPYGLQLIMAGLGAATHRGDVAGVLNLDPALEALRQEVADPNFVGNLVRSLLLDNPHRVRMVLRPDNQLAQRRDQAERDKLDALAAKLSDEGAAKIVSQARALAERQAVVDDPDALPKVTLEDIPDYLPLPKGQPTQIAGRTATVYHQGTNGLIYQQAVLDLPQLGDDEIDILPIYTSCLTEVGFAKLDYLAAQKRQSQFSGGLGAYATVRGAIDDVQKIRGHLVLAGRALARNAEPFTELLHQTLHQARFDELPRLRDLVAQLRTGREHGITHSGHTFAMSVASSGMSASAALSHRLGGLEGIRRLKLLDNTLDDPKQLEALAERLRNLHSKILTAPQQLLSISEANTDAQTQKALAKYWQPHKASAEQLTLDPVRTCTKQIWSVQTAVHFCAKVYPTVPPEHPDAAPLTVLGGFLRNGFLHTAIREKGGAYGGGAGHDAASACFRFYSYRDPRLHETLADFDAAIDWALGDKPTQNHLEEAVLGVMAGIDKPGSPAGEAKRAFHSNLYGRTDAYQKTFRDRVIEVTLKDLKRVTETYLTQNQGEAAPSIAVVTHAEAAQEHAQGLGLEQHAI